MPMSMHEHQHEHEHDGGDQHGGAVHGDPAGGHWQAWHGDDTGTVAAGLDTGGNPFMGGGQGQGNAEYQVFHGRPMEPGGSELHYIPANAPMPGDESSGGSTSSVCLDDEE